MKVKYIAAILTYFATFTLSVVIVGLPASKGRITVTPNPEKRTFSINKETELQARIRRFLEDDYRTGIELANDKARLSHSYNSFEAEKTATHKLVEKMSKVKCDGLPEDFCSAWDQHVVAWEYKAYSLKNRFKNGMLDNKTTNEQISNSYRKMISSARNHGVDFKY